MLIFGILQDKIKERTYFIFLLEKRHSMFFAAGRLISQVLSVQGLQTG